METWLFSIVGIVFLSILVEVIYPNGKTNKFCKSIFGLIAVYVMISPILSLKDIDFDKSYIDKSIVSSINNAEAENYAYRVKIILKDIGIDGAFVEVKGYKSENGYEVDNIYIDVSNAVLSKNVTNINKYEVIINELSNKLKIHSDRVIVYG